MRSASLHFFAISLALILAACGGQVRWDKPGSDDALLAGDLSSCRSAAYSAIQRMYGAPQISPSSGLGPFGGPPPGQPSPADRHMREQEAVNRCMNEKGYKLVSDPK